VAYLVIGAFPATMGLQQVMRSHVGLGLLVAGLLAGGVLTVMQFRPLWSELRAIVEPSLHERPLRLQARIATAVASLAGGLLMLGIAVVERDPSASIVSTFHVLDAISDALVILGLALIVASFIMFPPFGFAVTAGVGGAVLVPTVTGSFVIATAAGATLASLGMLMNESSGSSSSGGSGGSGGNPPPRFTDNTRQSRTYGNSVSDIRGQANRYAERMERRGYTVNVPELRTGKYSGPDITVTVIKKNGDIKHIRHFIVK
jgi:hypothetical protein